MNNNILVKDSRVPAVAVGMCTEGVDFINVSKYGKSDLGRMLAPGYPISTMTILGKLGTLRAGMDYIATPDYPKKLLSYKRLSTSDIRTIPRRKKNLPNYWAIVAYLMCERVKSDYGLQQLLAESPEQAVFTSFNEDIEEGTGQIKFDVYKVNYKMGMYLSIIRSIRTMLIHGRFDNETILDFVGKCKDVPDTKLFADLDVVITPTIPMHEQLVAL